MQLIPVLDLMAGRAVRAIGSRPRGEYPPLHSALAGGAADLTSLAHGLRQLEPPAVYVADLDAIEGRPGNAPAIETLCVAGLKLWLDAGFRSPEHAERVLKAHRASATSLDLVAGLESLPNPQALSRLIDQFGPERVLFSLDLRDSRPLANAADWGTTDAHTVAEVAMDCGARRLILLDLAAVGRGAGTPTAALCARLRTFGGLELITGGGVRGEADLRTLAEAGCNSALLGAAFMRGALPRRTSGGGMPGARLG